MSLVTAVSWELKVKPHKGRNAGKKGGKVNTKEGKTDKPPNVHLKTCEHFGTRGAIKRNFFGGGVLLSLSSSLCRTLSKRAPSCIEL